jgi:hypothetical protein
LAPPYRCCGPDSQFAIKLGPGTQIDPLPLFLSLLFSEGFATQLDPVRVVNDAVQNGVRERGIADQVMPSFDRDLAGDQRGAATAMTDLLS